MKNFKKGFTLIELLVVISIIELLSSIALASLDSARKKAEGARVVSELRSLKNALELYRTDYGKYPAEGEEKIYGDTDFLVEDALSFLKTKLVDGGYIPTMPNLMSDLVYGTKTWDVPFYVTMLINPFEQYFCGDRKVSSYLFYFYNELDLNLDRVGVYSNDYDEYFDYTPFSIWFPSDNVYCIGE